MTSQTMLSSSAPNGNSEPDLARQPSIYALTLQEIQNAINEPGKSFGSMNMEEFIKSLWTAEESQAMVAAMTSSVEINGLTRQSSLQRLNSLSLPPTLSRKTVEDVWKDIQRRPLADSRDQLSQSQELQNQQHQRQQRQIALGEMTLEDFLVRAGVVNEDLQATAHIMDGSNAISQYSAGPSARNLSSAMDALTSSNLQSEWMNFESHGQMLQRADAATSLVRRELPPAPPRIPAGDTMYDQLVDGTGLGSDNTGCSIALSPDYALHSRKRLAPEAVIEKTMERRQKRMIKNRESAARSRARKQAYTVELEAEVTKLKEDNARLKQEQALVSCLPESRYSQKLKLRVLRRTRSW